MAECEVIRFFRPLLPNFSTKLFIPTPLAENIGKGNSRDKVTLVSHMCKIWHVDLHIEHKDMYLGGESWKIFVQDNELEIGQLLFFKYKGNMVFSFRVFDLTSCERMPRKKRIIKEFIDLEQSSHSSPKQAVSCGRKRRGQEDQKTSKAEHRACSSGKKRQDERMTSKSTQYCTQNAYFEATIMANNLKHRYLYVPATFRECSGLSAEHAGLSIRNPNGRTWLIGLTQRAERMSKGWSEFAAENGLGVGDKLRFQMVSAKGKDNLMYLNMIKL